MTYNIYSIKLHACTSPKTSLNGSVHGALNLNIIRF